MNRTIKFRLRTGNHIVGYEKWYPGHYTNEGLRDANPCWLYSDGGEHWTPKYINHEAKDAWTGLTDKNGVEVFEGDIIRRFNGIIATVVYEGTAYETHPIRGQRLHESDLRLDFDAVDKLEVIGNIYENPELLETK